ncbi:hypothetical protein PPYR_02699 [Photinus pyralis]|uniref:Uncharacterized protein n=2 Tax=Photinus pyralis TaxID=7054 RepID=A0A5N4A0S7_PHOPY|nr:uncharacterized protein LOC116161822 [Photinus pyralis]KAB0790899.1 hypothetical protein PPYR_02699 [Photinus pyralis]
MRLLIIVNVNFVLLLLGINEECASQLIVSRGTAEVERPLLLNSYLPASMQIIAYLTDLMKYETKPSDGVTTTTTVRPTPFHKPGLYSPQNPIAHYVRSSYGDHPQRPLSYFDRYGYFSPRIDDDDDGLNTRLDAGRVLTVNNLPRDLDLLGSAPASVLKLINQIDEYDSLEDDDDKLRRFTENYDDAHLRQFVVGNKRPPPVQAYVTLLQLYDSLNQESKRLQLNKYGGYTSDVLQILVEISQGTSAEQLQEVLKRLAAQRNTRDPKTTTKINNLLKDLDTPNSYIHAALQYIPPLNFIL